MFVKFNEKSQRIFPSDIWSYEATKLLERCEVCPSWPTEKAQKYRTKAKNSEQSHNRTKLTTGFLKCKISQSNTFMQKAHG